VLALNWNGIQVGSKHYTISTSEYRRWASSRTDTVPKKWPRTVSAHHAKCWRWQGAGNWRSRGGGLGGGCRRRARGSRSTALRRPADRFSLQAPLTVDAPYAGAQTHRAEPDPTTARKRHHQSQHPQRLAGVSRTEALRFSARALFFPLLRDSLDSVQNASTAISSLPHRLNLHAQVLLSPSWRRNGGVEVRSTPIVQHAPRSAVPTSAALRNLFLVSRPPF